MYTYIYIYVYVYAYVYEYVYVYVYVCMYVCMFFSHRTPVQDASRSARSTCPSRSRQGEAANNQDMVVPVGAHVVDDDHVRTYRDNICNNGTPTAIKWLERANQEHMHILKCNSLE